MSNNNLLLESNEVTLTETIKLIKKDVHWTLPSSNVFRNLKVQESLCRVLLIYSIRKIK